MSAPEARIPMGDVIKHVIRTVDGKPVAVHWRQYYENAPKSLGWEQPDGTSGLGGRASSSLPFYNTEKVKLFDAQRVVITEGEMAAQALTDLGILALGTVTGSGGCPDAAVIAETVANLPEDVYLVLWPDNAPDGLDHMRKVADAFRAAGVKDIRERLWIQGPKKGDAADFVVGKTLADVLDFIDQAEPYAFSAGWPEPEPLPTGLLPVLPYNPMMLPESLRGWTRDITERMQCPPDFVAATAVVEIAALVGRQVGIRPKRKDNWTVTPNLYGGLIGDPGLMKTPALEETLKPLERIAAEAAEQFKKAQQDGAFEVKFREAQKKALDRELTEAVKKGATVGELDDLKARYQVEEAARPVEKRYIVNDTTVEKLGMILNENPNGVLYKRDELPGWFAMMDREGHEGDRSFYCECWNGTSGYTYDRVGRGTLVIEAAILSVIGGIQPGPLQAYLHEMFASGISNDGLIQRFQIMVWPDRPTTWRNVDRDPDMDARRRAYQAISALLTLDPVTRLKAETDPDNPSMPYLRFTDEAQVIFDAWRERFEALLIDMATESPILCAHFTKYRSLMPSLALLFHLVDGGTGPVTAEAARLAIRWCNYLASHARRIYQSVTQSGEQAAVLIGQKILNGKLGTEFRQRTITQKGWGGLTEPKIVARGLDVLLELGWVREKEDTPGSRKTTTYEVNPKVLEQASEGSEGASVRKSDDFSPPPPPEKSTLEGETSPQNTQQAQKEAVA